MSTMELLSFVGYLELANDRDLVFDPARSPSRASLAIEALRHWAPSPGTRETSRGRTSTKATSTPASSTPAAAEEPIAVRYAVTGPKRRERGFKCVTLSEAHQLELKRQALSVPGSPVL